MSLMIRLETSLKKIYIFKHCIGYLKYFNFKKYGIDKI